MDRPWIIRTAEMAYAAVLLLSSRVLRHEFGEEIRETFRSFIVDEYRGGGAWTVVRATLRAQLDALLVRPKRPDEVGFSARGKGGSGMQIGSVLQDTRVGIRMLVRRPLFAITAVATLALGIGLNTAIFTVVRGVVLRPLPFPDPGRLVSMYHVNTARGSARGSLSHPDLRDWQDRASSFDQMAVYTTGISGLLFTTGGEPVEVSTAYVSGGFFPTLGRDAYVGRTLLPEEEFADNRAVVLSHDLWVRRFGSDPGIVSGTITLEDEEFRVAGVMPPDFAFPTDDVEAWAFISLFDQDEVPWELRQVRWLQAVGRLTSGVTVEAASSELSAISAGLLEEYPEENAGLDAAALVPLHDIVTRGVGRPLLVLLGAVGLVLLIACANVGALFLSRGMERSREIVIRWALGAGRRRLLRQLLTESLVLAGLGGVLGIALSFVASGFLMDRAAGLLPRTGEVRTDGIILAFGLGATAVTAVLFGLAPALSLTRQGNPTVLRAGARGGRRGPGGGRLWSGLVTVEVALAVVLAVGSGLLFRSLQTLNQVDPGLDTEELLAVTLTISDARYKEFNEYMGAYDRLIERMAGVPGVRSVSSIRHMPLPRDGEDWEFRIPELAVTDQAQLPRAMSLQVSPGFFGTAGIPLLEGREITADDREGSPWVTVVNDALRQRYFPGEDVVGRHIDIGGTELQIVGVVGDLRQVGLSLEPRPTLYLSQRQVPRRGMTFLLRTDTPDRLIPSVRSAIWEVDPDQPITQMISMSDAARASTGRPRLFAQLLGGFAGLALLLALTGIYGVVSQSVGARSHEIGVRMALGASAPLVISMVVREGLRPVLVGTGIGIAVASLATRVLEGQLFGVRALDPVTFVSVPLLLLAVAVVACLLPASRASRLDPVETLMAE